MTREHPKLPPPHPFRPSVNPGVKTCAWSDCQRLRGHYVHQVPTSARKAA